MQNHSLGFVFPGQGSQQVGMLAEVAAGHPQVSEAMKQAGEVIGVDLWGLSQAGPAEQINQTAVTQPLLLAASVGLYHAWTASSPVTPAWMAGHSLGEYSALVCAGVLDFEAAVRVVRARGEFMQSAVAEGSGAMIAVIGLDDDVVRACCEQAAGDEVVSAVNFNAPGQVVVAGTAAAVERAAEACKAAGARRCLPLPVSVPSHCALMQPAAVQLAEVLAEVELRTPEVAVIHNVDGLPETDPASIRQKLVEQLYSPVLWVDSVRFLVDQGVCRLLECGPGQVLSGLIRRIDRNLEVETLDDAERFPLIVEGLDPH